MNKYKIISKCEEERCYICNKIIVEAFRIIKKDIICSSKCYGIYISKIAEKNICEECVYFEDVNEICDYCINGCNLELVHSFFELKES